MGWAHEWEVVDEDGRIRFVESDDAGVPADRKRYDALRAGERRGDLRYLGLVHRPDDGVAGTRAADDPGRSYAQDVLDAADIAKAVPGGALGLYRDI